MNKMGEIIKSKEVIKDKTPKRGRKTKYDEWLTPEALRQIRQWTLAGVSNEGIAAKIGMSPRYFYTWLSNDNDKEIKQTLKHILKRSRVVLVDEVEQALYHNAVNGDTKAQQIFLKARGRDIYGDLIEVKQETKVIFQWADGTDITQLKSANTIDLIGEEGNENE